MWEPGGGLYLTTNTIIASAVHARSVFPATLAVIFTLKAKSASKVGTCSRVGGSIQVDRKAVHIGPARPIHVPTPSTGPPDWKGPMAGGDGVVKNKVRFLPGSTRDLPCCSRISLLLKSAKVNAPPYLGIYEKG